jgi:hypothetical protein
MAMTMVGMRGGEFFMMDPLLGFVRGWRYGRARQIQDSNGKLQDKTTNSRGLTRLLSVQSILSPIANTTSVTGHLQRRLRRWNKFGRARVYCGTEAIPASEHEEHPQCILAAHHFYWRSVS